MKIMLSLAGAAALASAVLVSPPAQAAGCGGYVNVFVAGCAPWDNNPRRMPGTPGYQAPRTTPTIVQQQPRIVQPTTNNQLINTNRNALIGNDSAGLRARNGIVSDHGGGLVSNSGGTLRR